MSRIFCQNCGNELSTTEGCPKCGVLLPYIQAPRQVPADLCSHCRAPNRHGASFCFRCGQPINNSRKGKKEKSMDDNLPESLQDLLKSMATDEINKFEEKEGEKIKMSTQQIKMKKGQKRIGLWGPHASGKTAYMLSLYLASRMSGYEWLMSLDDVDDGARAFFDGMAEKFLQGDFPAPNPPEKGEPDIYNFVFYPVEENVEIKASRTEKKDELDVFWHQVRNWLILDDISTPTESIFPGIAVSFADVAGERYLLEPSNSILWDHLAGCHHLICIIDPDDFKGQFQATNRLGSLLKQKIRKEHPELLIENGRYLPHYISLCFSKIDRPNWSKYASDPNGLINELEKQSKVNIKRILSIDFSPRRTQFHSISSVGLKAEVQGQKIKNLDSIQPYQIFEPLNEWISIKENKKKSK